MTIQQLEYFMDTADYGSFSETAAHRYTTQPAVSRQIQQLEDELGFTLFDRNSKPLKLTAAGSVFYGGLGGVLNQLKALITMGEMAAKGHYGLLKIAFPTGLQAEDFFSEIFSNLKIACPGLSLIFKKIDTQEINDQLRSKTIDLAVALHTRSINDSEFNVSDICPIKSYILVNSSHPLAEKSSLDANDILNIPVYLSEPLGGYAFENGNFLGFRIDRKNVIAVDCIDSTLINVRYGNGITVVNSLMDRVVSSPDFKAFPALETSTVPNMCIVTRKGSHNPAVSFFCDLIRDYFRKNLP